MSEYRLNLSEQQIKELEESQGEIEVVEILTPDGRVIKTNDIDLVLILLGLNKRRN